MNAAEVRMPADPDAERSVLGAILLNAEHYHAAAERLLPEAFSLDSHRRLFSAMARLSHAGHEINYVTLVDELGRRREIESVGGAAYVISLTEGAIPRRNIDSYVQIVNEKAMLREAIHVANDIATRASDQCDDVHELVAEADRRFLDITSSRLQQEVSLEQQSYDAMAAIDAYRRGERVPSYPTGVAPLDLLTGGLPVGQLTVVAGRPSMGKSSTVKQVVITNCQANRFCHVITPEMTAQEFLNGLFAVVAEVPYTRVVNPEWMSREQVEAVRRASLTVSQWPLRIDDDPSISPDQLIARAKTIKRRNNTAILAVDYLQLLHFPGARKDLYMEVGDAAKRLAKLAKSEQIAVMLLSSLTEKSGGAVNTPPTLVDLRQSGDIQYHAHNAYLIHRERDEQSQEINRSTAFIVAKKRHGRTGNVPAWFNPETLLFEEQHPEGSLYD